MEGYTFAIYILTEQVVLKNFLAFQKIKEEATKVKLKNMLKSVSRLSMHGGTKKKFRPGLIKWYQILHS